MRRILFFLGLILLPLGAQTGAKNGEWPTYGADLGNTHYSPLDQINAGNFNKLQVAWRLKTDNFGPRPETNLQSTPLMVKGILYTTAGTRRAVVAANAATGEVLWTHSEDEGARGANAPRQLSGRGLAYWTDGREERILYVTPGYRLIALSAKTGNPVPGFGRTGVVDLKLDDDQEIDLETGEVGLHATPVVAGDVVIVGAAHRASGAPKVKHNVNGYVRGFDVRTGKRLWIFHTIPRPGEFGHDTWEKDSAETTGNAGVWGQISVDLDLGMAFIPVELPTGDEYGGHRPGNGLFGESVVAVDLKTGQRKWHYQLVHHGIWDFDIPCAPMLIDITINGRTVKAVAQPTKQGILYTFDRVTGQPIWPFEERPVPKGDVPGEWYSPTQPVPTKPPAYGVAGIPSVDELIDFTPELRAEALKIISKYKIGPIFTPIVVSKPDGPFGTILTTGVTNWPGGSYDPESHILYVHASTGMVTNGLVPGDPARSEFAWVGGTAAREGEAPALRVQGMPLVKPPWGSIVAIDMNKGEILWKIANAETPDNVRNHPALKGLNIPRTGRASNTIGLLVTKTLMIAGEPGTFTMPDGRQGAMLRAYDKSSGKEQGAVYMPTGQTGTPMTYMLNGKQYIVVAIAAANYPAELLAFRLPSKGEEMTTKIVGGMLFVVLAIAAGLMLQRPEPAQAGVPKFEVDPYWPKDLPNQWMMGQVAGIFVDSHDHVWVTNRPRSLENHDKYAGFDPPQADCCKPAPAILEFDAAGNFVQGWGGPGAGYEWPDNEHGVFVDYKENVWVGGNGAMDTNILKFTKDGKFLLQIGHHGKTAGSNDTENLNRPAGFVVYPKTNEVFVADGYGNRRVIVFDADSGAYKRHWGAYGKPPDDRVSNARTFEGEGPKQFNTVHSLRISSDDLVYVGDRRNNRIQVFKPDGTYSKEAYVERKTTGEEGTTFDFAFSPDAQQQFIYIPDGTNKKVQILDRQTLEVVGTFGGHGGHGAGQFFHIHSIATDSKGNVYLGESFGKRALKWSYKGMEKR